MAAGTDQKSVVDVRAEVHGAGSRSVNVAHGTFRCRRGYDLFTTTYQPSLRRTDACLVFHHGLADHSERHGEVLAHLCASLGMPVYTYDAHGHGRSGPHDPVGRALIRSYRHIIDDLLDFTRIFVAEAEDADTDLGVEAEGEAEGEGEASPAGPAPPARQGNGDDGNVRQFGQQQQQQRRRRRRKLRAFVLGYSMGGLATTLAVAETCPTHAATASTTTAIAVAAAATGSSLFEGLMLTSCLTDPLYGNHPVLRMVKVAYVTALSWLAPAVPMFKRNPVESGIRDPAAVAAMAEDTLWYRGRFKVATIASLLAGCARLRRTARRLTAVPLYVQHATVDMSCSLPSMHAFLARVKPVDLTMHVVEGAYHDLHHDPETPMLLGRMLEWLRKRV